MFAIKTLGSLCSSRAGKARSMLRSNVHTVSILGLLVQQSVRTAKVFKPNLLIKKNRTIKVQDGQWVEKDTVLTLQNNLVLYPGENVNDDGDECFG